MNSTISNSFKTNNKPSKGKKQKQAKNKPTKKVDRSNLKLITSIRNLLKKCKKHFKRKGKKAEQAQTCQYMEDLIKMVYSNPFPPDFSFEEERLRILEKIKHDLFMEKVWIKFHQSQLIAKAAKSPKSGFLDSIPPTIMEEEEPEEMESQEQHLWFFKKDQQEREQIKEQPRDPASEELSLVKREEVGVSDQQGCQKIMEQEMQEEEEEEIDAAKQEEIDAEEEEKKEIEEPEEEKRGIEAEEAKEEQIEAEEEEREIEEPEGEEEEENKETAADEDEGKEKEEQEPEEKEPEVENKVNSTQDALQVIEKVMELYNNSELAIPTLSNSSSANTLETVTPVNSYHCDQGTPITNYSTRSQTDIPVFQLRTNLKYKRSLEKTIKSMDETKAATSDQFLVPSLGSLYPTNWILLPSKSDLKQFNCRKR